MPYKYKIALLLFFIILFLPSTSYAQQGNKKEIGFGAIIVDAFTRKAIDGENVKVYLLRKDSTVINSFESTFVFDYESGVKHTLFRASITEQPETDFILKFTHKGYQTTYTPIHFIWKKRWASFNRPVTMRRSSIKDEQRLDEVTVTATKIKFYTKNDTLVFNADAFQLQEGSMLDGLIKQLPGAELKSDGQIFVNGKKVQSLMLNGRDFFKGDNTVLLDNLPAYMVEQVKVYNKESETSKLLGSKVDQGIFVMDVALKRQYAIGWLANTEWGYGSKDRFLGRLFAMRYTPQSRVTLFGNLNNVNDRRKPDGDGGWGDFDPSGGLTTTRHAGVDYSVYDKRDRFKIEGNAETRYVNNNDTWAGKSTDFITGGDMYNVLKSVNKNSNLNISTEHLFKFYNKLRNGFSLSPSFNYTKTNSHTSWLNGTFDKEPTANYTEILDSLNSPDWTKTMRNLLRRNDEKAKGNSRNVNGGVSLWSFFKLSRYSRNGYSIEADAKFSDQKSYNYNHFGYDHYADGTLISDNRNRYNPYSGKSVNLRGMLKYFWHWSNYAFLNPNYTVKYSHSKDNIMRYRLELLDDGGNDKPLGWLPSHAEDLLKALDGDNSNESTLDRVQHIFTLDWQLNKFIRNDDGHQSNPWYVQLKPYLIVEDNDFNYNGVTLQQRLKKNYVLPQFDSRVTHHTKGDKHELQLYFNINTASPNMSEMVNRTSTADPLKTWKGNPNLKMRTDYYAALSYRSMRWLQSKERSLWGDIGWQRAHNAIASKTVFDRQTSVRTIQSINVDGNWNAWANIGYTTPLDKKHRLTLTNRTSGNYYHSVDFISTQADASSVRTTTKSSRLNEELNLNYRFKKVNIGAKGSVGYLHSTADRDDYNNVNTWNINYGANAILDLPWNIQLSTDISMFTRRGYQDSEMNRSDLVWNARLAKRVMHGRLTFMLDAWDILSNLTDTSIGANSTYRWEYYTNVIPRYVMLRATYRLDKRPKKQ